MLLWEIEEEEETGFLRAHISCRRDKEEEEEGILPPTPWKLSSVSEICGHRSLLLIS